jgi:pSer/pThr/pTyr-binding forkhead associated (FHA) protein/DNA-binding winged helix-turn-helix (wHTH) protein
MDFGVVRPAQRTKNNRLYYKRLLASCCIINPVSQERNKTMDGKLEEAPLLIGQTGPLKGERWELDKPLTIGREATCEVVILDRQVSRFHARLTPITDGVILEDLESKNGTHRNGTRVVGKVALQDGDTVQIALAQQFIYLTSDATMPLADFEKNPGRLRMDEKSRRVWVDNRLIDPPLSALQFHVLLLLYENQSQVVDRALLISDAWGDEQAVGVSDQALDALLRRLRDRIAELDSTQQYIITVRGHGVKLENPPME